MFKSCSTTGEQEMAQEFFANVEVVNDRDTRFANAKDGDLVFSTETSNQAIHFGNKVRGTASLTLNSNNVEFGSDIFVKRDLVMRGLKIFKRLGDDRSIGNITQRVESVKGLDATMYNVDFTLSNPQVSYRFYDDAGVLMVNLSNQSQLQANSANKSNLPTFTWMNDNETGLYNSKYGEIGIATHAQRTAWINSSNANFTTPLTNTETTTEYVYDILNVDNYKITGNDTNGQLLFVHIMSFPLETNTKSVNSGLAVITGVIGGESPPDCCSFDCKVSSRGGLTVLCDRRGSKPVNADMVVYKGQEAYNVYLKCQGKHMYNFDIKHGGQGFVINKTFQALTALPLGSAMGTVFDFTGMVMNDSNHMGISTTNPRYTIDANVSHSNHVRIYSTDKNVRASAMIYNSNTMNMGGALHIQQDGQGDAYIDNFGANTQIITSGEFVFKTRTSPVTTIDRVALKSSGRLGINTTNPLQQVHVVGTALIAANNNSNLIVPSASQCMIATNEQGRNQFMMGHNNADSNTSTITYTHISNSSPSNYVSIGIQGSSNILNVLANERIGIRKTKPIATVDVVGDIASTQAIATASRLLTNKMYYCEESEVSLAIPFNYDLSLVDLTKNFTITFLWRLVNNEQFGTTATFGIANMFAINFQSTYLQNGTMMDGSPCIYFTYETYPMTLLNNKTDEGPGLIKLPIPNATWGFGQSGFPVWDEVPIVITYNAAAKRVTFGIGGNDYATLSTRASLGFLKERHSASFACDLSGVFNTKRLTLSQYAVPGRSFYNYIKSFYVVSDFLELGTDKLNINNLVAMQSIRASGCNNSVSAPSITWANDTKTGFYYARESSGAGTIGIAVGACNVATMGKNYLAMNVPFVKQNPNDATIVTDIMNITHHELTGLNTFGEDVYVQLASLSSAPKFELNTGCLMLSGIIGSGSSDDTAFIESEIITRGKVSVLTRMSGSRSANATIIIYNNTSTEKYDIYIRVKGVHFYNLTLKTVGTSITLYKDPFILNYPSKPIGTIYADIFDTVVFGLNTNMQIVASNDTSPHIPSYSWIGDTTTGIYHPKHSAIAFSTKGSNVMTIMDDFVGVATTQPRQTLDVNGAILTNGLVQERNRILPAASFGLGVVRRTIRLPQASTLPTNSQEFDDLLSRASVSNMEYTSNVAFPGSQSNLSGYVFSGYVHAAVSGLYTFGINNKDASDVFIDGAFVASSYGAHSANVPGSPHGTSTSIYLQLGMHKFLHRVVNLVPPSGAQQVIELLWRRPTSSNWENIPNANLFHGVEDFATCSSNHSGFGVGVPRATWHVGGEVWGSGHLATHNGSSNKPAFSWSDSSNMGIYRIDNNAFALSLRSTPLVTWSNACMGVRIQNPTSTLHVVGDALVTHSNAPQLTIANSVPAGAAEIVFDKSQGRFSVGQKAPDSSNNYFYISSQTSSSSGERFIITPTGRIGINEDTPQSTIHICNPNKTDASIYMGTYSAKGYNIIKHADGTLNINIGTDNGSARTALAISSNGGLVVGSNNATDNFVLDVNVSRFMNGIARIYSSNSFNDARLQVFSENAMLPNRSGLMLQQSYLNGEASVDNGGTDMKFKTFGSMMFYLKKGPYGSSVGESSAMVIEAGTQNVGIGTSNNNSVLAKLDVVGRGLFSAESHGGVYIRHKDDNDIDSTTNFAGMYTQNQGVVFRASLARAPNNARSFTFKNSEDQDIAFMTNERMLGIGKTPSEALDVNGNIVASGSIIGKVIRSTQALEIMSGVTWSANNNMNLNVTSLGHHWNVRMARNSIVGGSYNIVSDYIAPGDFGYIMRCWAHTGTVTIPKNLIVGDDERSATTMSDVYTARINASDLSGRALFVGGDIHCTGKLTEASDIRLKEDIRVIDNALAKVDSLHGYTYKMKETKVLATGLVAQEVQKALPQAVSTTPEGTLSIAYGSLAGLFVEAIKDLKKELMHLRTRMDMIETRVHV